MKIPIVRLQVVKENEIDYGGEMLNVPIKAVQLVKKIIGESDREYIVVCCVNSAMKPTNIEIVGIGTSNTCLFGIPEIFKTAMLTNANGIIVFHTHPSGEAVPSKLDELQTKRLLKVGELLGIEIKDHIIIGEGDKYFSFLENELLVA